MAVRTPLLHRAAVGASSPPPDPAGLRRPCPFPAGSHRQGPVPAAGGRVPLVPDLPLLRQAVVPG